ncbi:hypothetical protein IAE49_13485 [Kosakonia sp. S58]|uniref:hypothetical protein n=1 Tax=unclassified Kosakonia TaxID=2632876 RepID=UPI001905F191|nr:MULTISPECIES: hypothetical protein [unclassified Kosakonia]MBK0080426.1 hypothetical protein [Kosakonia sp. S57]MBK0087250.1 hypothetical protein [Kosakonia sp. S58]
MQEIQAIQASPPLANTHEHATHKAAMTPSTENVKEAHTYQDESIKVTLSSKAESHKESKEVKAEEPVRQKKRAENQEIDYALEMSGIPQFGGRLVTVVKYPDGRTEMVDAFTGRKVTQEQLARAQELEALNKTAQQSKIKQAQQVAPGESTPTDMQ